MDKPLVSFLLPVYNGAATLTECLSSLACQTERDFEIVAIDDCSSDGSWEILKNFGERRIHAVRHSSNRGLANTLNHCMELARGRFFARMDQDDLCRPNRLEAQLRHLQHHGRHGLCGTAVQVIRETTRHGVWRYPISPNHVRACLTFSSPCAHPSLLLRREIYDRGCRYDPEYELAEDWDFLDRICQEWGVSNLPDVLLDYRLSPGGIGRARAALQKEAKKKVARRILSRLGLPSDEDSIRLHLEVTHPAQRDLVELECLSGHLRNVIRAAFRNKRAERGFLLWEIFWRWAHLCRAAGPGAWKKVIPQWPLP